ncbi:MAG: WD40 repeat domain-containing protein [Planctomycetota bacterium]
MLSASLTPATLLTRLLMLLMLPLTGPGSCLVAGPPITALSLTSDGQQLLTGSQAGLTLLSVPELQPLQSLPTQLQQVHDIRFSPDGRQFLVAGGTSGERGRIELHVWPATGEPQSIDAGEDLVYQAEWLDAGSRIAAAGADGVCRIVGTTAGISPSPASAVVEFTEHSQPVLAIRRLSETQLVTAGADQTLRLWDAKTLITRRSFNNHTDTVLEIAVRPAPANASAATRWVATAGADRTVRLWNLQQGRMLRFARLSAVPLSLAWASDGDLLFVGCSNGDVLTLTAAGLEQTPENNCRDYVLKNS